MRGFVPPLAVLALSVACAEADDKSKKFDPAKIRGKWELVKSTDPETPKGAIVDFTNDNAVHVEITADGKRLRKSGTYKSPTTD